MLTIAKVIAIIVILLLTLALSFVALLIAAELLEIGPGDTPSILQPLFILAVVGVPLTLVFLLGRSLRRHWLPDRSVGMPPAAGRLLLGAYAITVVFGLPACQSFRTEWAISEYKRLKASGSPRVWDVHPQISTVAAIPLLPGVVLEYHEYVLNGLYGFGGFELFVWYGAGVKSLGRLPLWVA